MQIFNDQGYVNLLETIPASVPEPFLTKDYFIAQAASHSTQKSIDTDAQVKNLIHKLYTWKHFSPFEQVVLSFEIKAPLLVFWQLDRHRTFQYSSHLRRSGRYTEYTEVDFYIPQRLQEFSASMFDSADLHLQDVIDKSLSMYKEYLKQGMPKEIARAFLPAWCMLYTERMQVDLKNLLHMLSLRTASAAQSEIRELAWAMTYLVEKEFPYTMQKFALQKESVNYTFSSI